MFALYVSFNRSASISPDIGRIAIPVALAFLGIAWLAVMVANVVREYSMRIQTLENRLNEYESSQASTRQPAQGRWELEDSVGSN